VPQRGGGQREHGDGGAARSQDGDSSANVHDIVAAGERDVYTDHSWELIPAAGTLKYVCFPL